MYFQLITNAQPSLCTCISASCSSSCCSTKRAHQVYRRVLGTPLTEDVLVFEEPNPQWFVDVTLTKDNQLICINSNDRVSSEVRILDSSRPFESPLLVHPRETGVQYFVEHNRVSTSTRTSCNLVDGLCACCTFSRHGRLRQSCFENLQTLFLFQCVI